MSQLNKMSYSIFNLQELTEGNVGEVNQDLREVIDEAGEEDQTVENLQVVGNIFTATTALLSEPTVFIEAEVSEKHQSI